MRNDAGSLYRQGSRRAERATPIEAKRRRESSWSTSSAVGEAARRLERQFIEVLAALALSRKG